MVKTILIVDHESNLTSALRFLLEQSGFRVALASSGTQAEAAMAETAPDVALVNTTLPDRSGYDLCQRLLQGAGAMGLPILMLTSHGLAVEREKAFSLGATDFIVKPFEPAAILGRIRSLASGAA
jgi:DNA-binding response OmpR family regulator